MPRLNFLKSDLIAGVTVALVLIPQALAYAQLAGLPAQYGLYAALFPPLIASVFGSSKHLSTGPIAVLSLMTSAALSQIYIPGINEYIGLAMLMAFMLGIFYLLLGILRLGGLVSFLSHPVIYGFTNATAIIIVTTQLSKFSNVHVENYQYQFQTIIAVLEKSFKSTDWLTLTLGIWALLLMFTLSTVKKRLPSVLITVFITTIISIFFGYNGPVIGNIPLGLPKIALPNIDLSHIFELVPSIIAMGLVGFTQAISVSQAVAVKTRDKISPNKELIGQGLANLTSAFFQGYSVSGSFSLTSVKFQAGAKTVYSSVFTAIVIILTLLFFTGFLKNIPQVTLAAVIVFSVAGLLDFKKIKYIWYTNRFDAIAAVLTFVTTLYFAPHLEIGIAIGVIFSIGYYLYRNIHPRIVFLSKYKDGQMHDAELFKMDRCNNIAVIRLDAPLFFANAPYFENEIINDVIKNQQVHEVLIVGSGINEIDATGEETLRSLMHNLKSAGKNLYLSEVKAPVMNLLTKSGFLKEIRKEHIFPQSEDAINYLTRNLEHKHEHIDSLNCPLKKYIKYHPAEHELIRDKRETIAYFFSKLIGHNNHKISLTK